MKALDSPIHRCSNRFNGYQTGIACAIASLSLFLTTCQSPSGRGDSKAVAHLTGYEQSGESKAVEEVASGLVPTKPVFDLKGRLQNHSSGTSDVGSRLLRAEHEHRSVTIYYEELDVSQILEKKAAVQIASNGTWYVFDLEGRFLTYSLATSESGSGLLSIATEQGSIANYEVGELEKECVRGIPEKCFDFGVASSIQAWKEDGDEIAKWMAEDFELSSNKRAVSENPEINSLLKGQLENENKSLTLHPTLVQSFNALFASCRGGHIIGCHEVAGKYEVGTGVEKDVRASENLYQQICDAGYPASCYYLARSYDFGRGFLKSGSKANVIALLHGKACSGGYREACLDLGSKYKFGSGVKQDLSKAASLYNLACNDGSPFSCFSLGELYQKGEGVAQDFVQAASLFDQACEAESGIACHHLALAYANGRGVAKDLKRAASLYANACSWNYQEGCNNLGLVHFSGEGVAKDLETAALIFDLLCEEGYTDGCSNLALLEIQQKS